MSEKKRRAFRFPIRVKTIVMIVVFGLILAEIAMVFFSLYSSRSNQDKTKKMATDLSGTVALSVNKDDVTNLTNDILLEYNKYDEKPTREKEGTPEFNQYMKDVAKVKETSYYKNLQSYLYSVKQINKDTDGIYLGYVDYDRKLTVYLVYDQENEAYPVGMIDPLYEEDYPLVDDHELGFVASIYNSELDGGMLCTAGKPVHDKDGNILCYALVDISMQDLRNQQARNIVQLFVFLVISVLGICIIGIIAVHFTLIKPVKTLQNATKSYDINDPEKTHQIFSNLHIYTHDEISELGEHMVKMENDINNKIKELTDTNEKLIASQQVAATMTELANKDGLTGVRNKSAYDKFVSELNEKINNNKSIKFGIAMVDLNYLKTINDDYGHDHGDSALIKLCNIICAIFAHSPVFRVGGDEFVVVFQNRDYHHSEKLIAEFNNKIDELSEDEYLTPAEKVSAAIGYAKYNPKTDKSVEDVFKRADKAMYERKHQMKEKDNK